MDATPEGTYPAPPRSWWSRNWKWAVPTGCLALILGCCGVGALATGLGLLEGVVKPGLSVYTPAVKAATGDARVQELLGAPVTAKPPRNSQLHSSNGESRAQLEVPLQGARAQGTLHVEARRQGETWTYDTLEVETEDGQTVDLREGVQQPGAPPPPAPPEPPRPPEPR